MTNNEKIKLIENIKNSMNELCEHFYDNDDLLNNGYPFDKSFDEMICDVENWLDTIKKREHIKNELQYVLNANDLQMNDNNFDGAIDYIFENYDKYENDIETYVDETLQNYSEMFEK